jgi:hypothetical protein
MDAEPRVLDQVARLNDGPARANLSDAAQRPVAAFSMVSPVRSMPEPTW